MPSNHRLTVVNEGDVWTIRFVDPRLFDDLTVREVFDQLTAATTKVGTGTVILDFSGVDSISSSMLGKLILLQRRMEAQQARLRLCEMNATVRAVFRSTNLDR